VARLVRWLDIAIFLGFTVHVFLTAPREGNWYAGLTVALVCIPFWIAARQQLGASFSLRPEARHLATGVLVTLLGLGTLAIAAVAVPVEILRARREGAVLVEKFGSQYVGYRERTWV